ncbi:MAG: hypothetical protein HGB14_04460 [Anaerolineaceae bacterium]|nr:hypothetical protein [Anaerolineaceae bacterium]
MAFAVFVTRAQAGTNYWTNMAASENFTNAANWNPGVPTTADWAYFTNNNTYTVNNAVELSSTVTVLGNGSNSVSLSGQVLRQ